VIVQLVEQDIGYKGQVQLRRVSLAVEWGERIAVVGPSGAGKSTLLDYLYQVLYQSYASQVTFCPQALGLVENLSVFHNIYMGCLEKHRWYYNLCNLLHPFAREIEGIKPIVKSLTIENQLHQIVAELSGGQKQRVALGRCLFQKSQNAAKQHCVFIGDEPVSSLDEYHSDKLLRLMVKNFSTSIVALHDVDLALKYFNRIVAIKQGEVVLDQAAAQLNSAALSEIYQ